MATFWERAAHSVNQILFVLSIFVILVFAHFGFEVESVVLIAPVPVNAHLLHCL